LPNWTDPQAKQFACLIHEDEQHALCLLFNASVDAIDFRLPPLLHEAQWHLAIDTACEAPQDLFAAGDEPHWENPDNYSLKSRSSVILLARCTHH
jgi:glycogen operon protein